MSKKLLLFVCMAISGWQTAAQTGNAQRSFEDFRKGMMDNFNAFRNDILTDYARFLDGVWTEYTGFKEGERRVAPKPETPPAILPEGHPQSGPAERTTPPAYTEIPPSSDGFRFTFSYYGIPMEIPYIDLQLMPQLTHPADYAEQWRRLDADGNAGRVVAALSELARKHNFNDYLTYDLTACYTLARYPRATPAVRTSLVHYILAHLGYDARIGIDNRDRALLLLAVEQEVLYGRMGVNLDNVKYYIFTDALTEPVPPENLSVSTCQLPRTASGQTKKIDMRLQPLAIPVKAQPFSICYGNLEIHGETNANLFPILYRYPQMPMVEYAESVLMPELRAQIVEQLRTQLAGKSRDEAVDQLLQFVQKGFAYAADEQFHGFEKPYFFEEVLFYDKNDCEDRVIFYTYLLWHVLGIENHLLGYPGHESAAVAVQSDREGDGYVFQGRKFFISDPTYIGAQTGNCMPAYRTVTPDIDYIYR